MLSAHVATKLERSGYRVVVTGAGGWIGSATLELLHKCLGAEDFARRVVAIGSSHRTLSLRDGVEVEQRPLAEIGALGSDPTLLLHLAFLTKDRAEEMDEEDYVRANRALSQTVLDALSAIGTQGVFVASSGAAYSAQDPAAPPAMRLYGALKKADEEAFSAWAETAGKPAVIARIFNLAGPYINKHTSYALASFILDALARQPIEVRATNRVVRGYVAIRELMSLVFALLLEGRPGRIQFDTGGEAMEMQAVAEAVASFLGPVAINRPSLTSDAANEYVGDAAGYAALLAERGIEPVTFEQQIAETAQFLNHRQAAGWMRQEQRDSALDA